MYDIDSIRLFLANGTLCSLSNICLGNGHDRFSTVFDLQDAVDDSEDTQSLLQNLKKLNLVGMDRMVIDHDSAKYTRIKGVDNLGNVLYLKVNKA